MARTSFEPVDDELTAHPPMAKTNSPWPICVVLFLGVITFTLMWYLSRGPIGVTRPIIVTESSRVILTSAATNRTNAPVHLSLRFLLAPGDSTPGFREIAHEDVDVDLGPHSSRKVHCDFALPQTAGKLTAQVQIVRRE